MESIFEIEVAYALEDEQFLFTQRVDAGTTVAQALAASRLLAEFPNLNIEKVGIFSKLASPETVLRAGDRIEVYRPLKIDPRVRRRERVEEERSQERKQ